jgi:large subunit ribosomal protein L4
VFSATPWNADLVHQVVVSMMRMLALLLLTPKTRGEVRGGGKKPWQQKGLGRARHGSIRSPIWVGGGVAHGPRNDKNFSRKINRKMKAKALVRILKRNLKMEKFFLLMHLDFKEPKAKEALEVLKSLGRHQRL